MTLPPIDFDLERPGALERAGSSLATARGDLIFMATGPDATSVLMLRNSLVTIAGVGLRRNVLLLADSWRTCEGLAAPCYWSSRVLRERPSDSLTMKQFWDWRFKFYYVKKRYIAQLVRIGYGVLQCDTDTVWTYDPFPMLHAFPSTIVAMRDSGLANAGIVYARPGGPKAQAMLDDVAWRVQLMQNWPDVVPTMVSFARPPYYANSDDQTLLNDAIVSAVIGNATFLGSTARFEARNRYNPKGPDWGKMPESKEWGSQMRRVHRSFRAHHINTTWARGNKSAESVRYFTLPIGPAGRGGETLAFAPRALFAHLPHSSANAITHLTAARGFRAKVSRLRALGLWHPEREPVPPGAAAAEAAAAVVAAARSASAAGAERVVYRSGAHRPGHAANRSQSWRPRPQPRPLPPRPKPQGGLGGARVADNGGAPARGHRGHGTAGGHARGRGAHAHPRGAAPRRRAANASAADARPSTAAASESQRPER